MSFRTLGYRGIHKTVRARHAGLFAALTLVLGWAASAPAAVVFLNLVNTEPLVDFGGTPLLGNSVSGDLVELYTVGVDGMIDAFDSVTGLPVTDDVLFGDTFMPTHVGAGTFAGGYDAGLLFQSNIEFDDSLVGTQVYVRFWDASSISSAASHFGLTGILAIPPPVLGEALLDFAPAGTGPYFTTERFGNFVPEPGMVAMLLSAFLLLDVRRRFLRCAVRPEHKLNER